MNFLAENCPFVHDRDFRAIMFSCPDLSSFQDVAELFFDSPLSKGEPHENSTKLFRIEHRFLYTPDDFTNTTEDRTACRSKWDGKHYAYRYSVFLARATIQNPNIFLIILPLMKMARKLYPKFEEKGRGKNVTYWKIDLQSLIEQLKGGQNIEGTLTLKSVKYAIFGDPKASNVRISGADVASCTTLVQVEESLKKKGIRNRPRVGELLLINRESDQRFNLAISNPGHVKFYLSSGTENFPMLGGVLGYLWKLKLNRETGFPPFRQSDEDNEN